MRNIFFCGLVLLNTALLYSQAAIDIPLIISDNMSNTKTLYFGLDPTATNCIDPQLGESDLPPLPSIGVYEVRWHLAPYCLEALWTYNDYRYQNFYPPGIACQHRLKWQLGQGATQLSITYNLPSGALFVTMQLKDLIGGLVINSPVLTGSGTFVINNYATILSDVDVNITYNYLPVELTSFTFSLKGSEVKLDWVTATEVNNKGFSVERKIKEGDWETLAFVEGYGTTTERHNYTYTDNINQTGKVHYRLNQIDFDGGFEYSDILEVNVIPAVYTLEQNYPNPFNPSTKIKYSIVEEGLVNLSVYDLMGQKVAELKNEILQTRNYETVFDASSLSSGVYVYKLNAGGKVLSRKMILLR